MTNTSTISTAIPATDAEPDPLTVRQVGRVDAALIAQHEERTARESYESAAARYRDAMRACHRAGMSDRSIGDVLRTSRSAVAHARAKSTDHPTQRPPALPGPLRWVAPVDVTAPST